MTRTLVTGMSATGKSTTVRLLVERGVRAVDLDSRAWSHLVADETSYGRASEGGEAPTDWRWREDAVRELLGTASGDDVLVVSGTSTHQGRLYPLLEHVVVLTVPDDVAVERLRTRTSNTWGKAPGELERELELREVVGPLLERGACLVLDTSAYDAPQVADLVAQHAALPACPR